MTNNGQFTKIPSHEVSTLDSHFDRFQDSIKPILIAAADGTISHEAYEAAMKQFALEMFGLRGKFMGTDEFFDRFSKMIGIQIP
jgi:hypothetical protein